MQRPKILLVEQSRQPERELFESLAPSFGLEVCFVDAGALELHAGAQGLQVCPPSKGFLRAADYSALVVRSYRRFAVMKALAFAFAREGKPVYGADPLHPAFCQDKLCDIADLAHAGLPVPRTRAASAPVPGEVLKNNWGYGGSGVRLFQAGDDVDTWNTHVQEFLPADADWRVLLCNGLALPWVVVREPAQGDFRTNTHQGGQLQVVRADELPHAGQMMALAERAGCVLGRPCAGVDLRRSSTGEPCILEVNRTPRLRLGAASAEVVSAYLRQWAFELNAPDSV